MCTLSEVVLDIFLPNRQYQCYPYIISSTLYRLYFNMGNLSSTTLPDDMSSTPLLDDMSSAPLPDDMSSAPLPDDVSSAPLPDDMSSALQRNISYLFEV